MIDGIFFNINLKIWWIYIKSFHTTKQDVDTSTCIFQSTLSQTQSSFVRNTISQKTIQRFRPEKSFFPYFSGVCLLFPHSPLERRLRRGDETFRWSDWWWLNGGGAPRGHNLPNHCKTASKAIVDALFTTFCVFVFQVLKNMFLC